MDYTNGKQPCQQFRQQQDGNAYGIWGNEHQCPTCGGRVSFCETCFRDHHADGWETCQQRTAGGQHA